LIEKATAEELFILMPSHLAEGSNQLVKLSDATMFTMPL